MKTGFTVQDIMSKNVYFVDIKATIREAAKYMKSKKTSSVLIKDKGKFIGVATEDDFLRAIAEGLDCSSTPISKIMTKKLLTINANEDIYNVLDKMRKKNVRRFPIKHKNEIIGFITMKDILKYSPDLLDIIEEKEHLSKELNEESNQEEKSKGFFGWFGK